MTRDPRAALSLSGCVQISVDLRASLSRHAKIAMVGLPATSEAVYGNCFGHFGDHFSTISQLCVSPPRVAWCALRSARAYRVLICACDPILRPIHVFRAMAASAAARARKGSPNVKGSKVFYSVCLDLGLFRPLPNPFLQHFSALNRREHVASHVLCIVTYASC